MCNGGEVVDYVDDKEISYFWVPCLNLVGNRIKLFKACKTYSPCPNSAKKSMIASIAVFSDVHGVTDPCTPDL